MMDPVRFPAGRANPAPTVSGRGGKEVETGKGQSHLPGLVPAMTPQP